MSKWPCKPFVIGEKPFPADEETDELLRMVFDDLPPSDAFLDILMSNDPEYTLDPKDAERMVKSLEKEIKKKNISKSSCNPMHNAGKMAKKDINRMHVIEDSQARRRLDMHPG